MAQTDLLSDLRQLPYGHKMAAVAACTLLRVASRATSPTARLLLTLPVLAANAAIPLLFQRDTEGVTIAFSGFMLTWCGAGVWAALGRGCGARVWAVLGRWCCAARGPRCMWRLHDGCTLPQAACQTVPGLAASPQAGQLQGGGAGRRQG